MSEPLHDGVRRRALCVGLGTFGELPALPFAEQRTGRLIDGLTKLGYDCVPIDPVVRAADLGAAVDSAIRAGSRDDILIVHVLSHGSLVGNDGLHVMGSDGQADPHTNVEHWLRSVSDFDTAPLTLFLLDICYSGAAARFHWQTTRVTATNRAWVISACGPAELAYGGRFTEAVANVLGGLADGTLDIDPSYRHAPLPTIAQRIRQEVARLAPIETSMPQQVTASLVDISSEPPDVAFFPNLAYAESSRRRIRPRVDVAIAPFLDDLDEALDPEHFATRASGKGFADTGGEGFFSGRSQELKTLAPWINLQDDVGLRVLTGSPGAGKSALIGILVCAAHPVLREPTRPVWEHVEQAPYRNEVFAAVHARQRSLDEIVTSIARQLEVTAVDSGTLVQAVADLPEPPVIVVDALDEAADGRDVMDRLLLPLARIQRADDEPVRLLVGMRPWPEFSPLRTEADEHGKVTDLDAVTPLRLRRDVQQYISRLLVSDERWDRIEYEGAAHTLARAVAETLTAKGPGEAWGAFLVAGLFTHHVLTAYPEPLRDSQDAARLGRSAPRTLPDLLDLDLRIRSDNPLLRPVLTALSHARGEGMPAEIIRQAAAPFTTDGSQAEPATLLKALEAARFYLRHSVEVDGTTRYRLFHQGLSDHLHEAARAGEVFDALLPLRWDLAEPYVLRHAADHAAEAGRLDRLLSDGEYLITCEPADLLDHTSADSDNPTVRAYRVAAGRRYPMDVDERRVALAYAAAADGGGHDLLTAMTELPHREPMTWVPEWVSGFGNAKVALIDQHGRSTVLLTTADYSVTHLLNDNGWLIERREHDRGVTAVAGGSAWGRPAIAVAMSTTVKVFGLGDVPLDVRLEIGQNVRQLAFAEFGGRPAVLVVGPDGTTMWDLETGQRLAELEVDVLGPASARVGDKLIEVDGPTAKRPHAIVVENDEPVDLDAGSPLIAATIGVIDDLVVVCTGHEDGVLRAWDPRTWELIDQVSVPDGIVALHADEHGRVIVVRPDDVVSLRHRPSSTLPAGTPDQRRRIGTVSFAYPAPEELENEPETEDTEPVPDHQDDPELGLPVLGHGPIPAEDLARRAKAEEDLGSRDLIWPARTVGIDLGSAKVTVAVAEAGSVTVLRNAEGARTTPSVVAVSRDGEDLVGEVARRQAVTNPDRTVRPIKREIDVGLAVDRNGNQYAPREVWTSLLEKARHDAGSRLGSDVSAAVITVPSTFDENQRSALRDAAHAAGLTVPFLISSATATALAYGLDKAGEEQTVLVFDLGGTTLDVSVLEFGDGVVEVRSTAGDDHLGGDDWDLRIVDQLVAQFRELHDVDLRTEPAAMERLREAAEKAKVVLSAASTADITLPYLITGPSGPVDLIRTLSRAEFQQLTRDLLDRARRPFEEAVLRAGLTAEKIDQVVLAGGSSRMPAVQELIRSLTGREPSRGVNPDEAAAAGAAIKAAALTGNLRDVMLIDVTPHSLGIGTAGDAVVRLIDRGSTLPTRKSAEFALAEDGQRSALIRVFQGEKPDASDNLHLGVVELTGLPSAARIEVTIDVEADGTMQISAREPETGIGTRATIAGGAAIPRRDGT